MTRTNDEVDPRIDPRRRGFLAAGIAGLATMTLPAMAEAAHTPRGARGPDTSTEGDRTVNRIRVKDGTDIHFRDWGTGQPVVFSHGWPLTGDAWDPQMLFLLGHGYRVIAHDRRGHGRSGQPSHGNDMDTYADDLAELIEALDLEQVVLVGHSTGGGEVTRYVGRHGTRRVAKLVLVAAIPPIMLRTAANPGGLPIDVFDDIRAGVMTNRSQFYRDLGSGPFFGFNRPGATPSQGMIESFWLQGMMGGVKGQYECVKQFSETDFTEDLKKIDVPTLIVHGDDDQIVPIAASAELASKLVRRCTYKVYRGGAHGLALVQQREFNSDLLAFVRG